MAKPPLLLFGFGPFLQFDENPSEKVARSLNGSSSNGHKIIGKVLPVDYHLVGRAIMKEIEKCEPAVVLGTGLAAGRSLLGVEKIAVNYKYSEEPDNKGSTEKGALIEEGGPEGIFSNLQTEKTVELLNRRGIPAALSLSAGAYLCNCAMYVIVRQASKNGFAGGFVHLPCDEQMASRKEFRRYPFMNLESMIRGIRIVLQNGLKSEP